MRKWGVSVLYFPLACSRPTVEELLEEDPGIEREDIFACLAYGVEITR
ncbi:hypothetical protein [Okeania sp. SIO2C2]|nr:hypothetical protein [Okeania sp. SIO2C2]